MKRFSIKARVTVWYTVFMLLLAGSLLALLFLMSEGLSQRRLRMQLKDAVADTVADVHFRYGNLNTEDLDFYKNGVSLFIYDTSGYLLAPKVNLGVQVDSLLQDQTARTLRTASGGQMVYDVYATDGSTPFWVRGIVSLEGSVQIYGLLRFLVLGTFPFFILLVALGGYQVTKRAFRPIGQMAETADRITSGKDLSQRIDTGSSQDELGRLGATMNRMLARLQDSFETERQFTSDVSHELRTPLSVIRSQCEYGLSEAAGERERQEALASIARQANRMNAMVSQLLFLSRAERGAFSLEKKELDLSGLVEDCAMDLMAAAEARGLSLQTDIAPGLRIFGDETMLLRLVDNLLTNAIRYNREGGSICLSLEQTPEGHIRLSVRDTGIGIRKEDLPRIWNRFYRADPSRHSEGTGLGLSMVKWIAEAHGGTVSADSVYGEGSCFTVLL